MVVAVGHHRRRWMEKSEEFESSVRGGGGGTSFVGDLVDCFGGCWDPPESGGGGGGGGGGPSESSLSPKTGCRTGSFWKTKLEIMPANHLGI